MHIPVRIGPGRAKSGARLPLTLEGENHAGADDSRVLELTENIQRFVFVGMCAKNRCCRWGGISPPPPSSAPRIAGTTAPS